MRACRSPTIVAMAANMRSTIWTTLIVIAAVLAALWIHAHITVR